MTNKWHVCVLSNENPFDHQLWISAIKKNKSISNYDIVDLTSDKWLQLVSGKPFDIYILRPPGRTNLFKQLYDERVFLINQYLSIPIYPSITEILIYENKRFLRDWLMVNKLPHPETHVFYNKAEAYKFGNGLKSFPIVAKTNIGASGNGVTILQNKEQVLRYIDKSFLKGIKPRTGPKLKKGSIIKKIWKAVSNKHFLQYRIKEYKPNALSLQFHFVIFQEFINHQFEWRCVRIGNSFFAHKKMVKRGKASGNLKKNYDEVPIRLLNFIKEITDKHNLTSVAIDVFDRNSQFLINEIQCFFGQSDPYQMLVDNDPGRYIHQNGQWIFEKGMFNTNESYDLRLENAISLLKECKLK